MRPARTLLTSVLRDSSGNVLPIATIGMLLAAAFVGSAIDLSRDYKVMNQLQAACDAGVLAGRRTVTTDGFDTASRNAANAYFTTNFDDAMQETRLTSFVPTSVDDGKTVTAVATTTLDTLIMRIFDRNEFFIRVTCASSMGVGNADVMMVLDTTGSMASPLGTTTRIDALREAMINFYGTLDAATADTNARIRYGFVPYSTTVNVGRLIAAVDPRYLANSATYQSRQPIFNTTTVQVKDGWKTPVTTHGTTIYTNSSSGSWVDQSTGYTNSGCSNAKPTNEVAYSDYGTPTSLQTTTINGLGQQVVTTTTTQPQRKASYQCVKVIKNNNTSYSLQVRYDTRNMISVRYDTSDQNYRTETTQTFDHWTYKPMGWDTSIYKTFVATPTTNGTNGATANYTWPGCIHERRTSNSATFSYSAALGAITPTAALDVNLDTPPDLADEGTKWAPMWPEITYRRFTDTWGSTRSLAESLFGSRATSYCPAAAQNLEEMDESSFETYANSLVAVGNTYLDIGMIWGGRMLSPQGIFQDNVNDDPANGGEVSRHIIFMTDGFMEPNIDSNVAWGIEWYDRKVTADGSTNDAARHTQRFLAVCQAIKDKGIRVWVIAFTSALSNDLKACASDNSSYTANSAGGLNTAFQEIAKQVGELRITE